jgi:hypothetical protein
MPFGRMCKQECCEATNVLDECFSNSCASARGPMALVQSERKNLQYASADSRF